MINRVRVEKDQPQVEEEFVFPDTHSRSACDKVKREVAFKKIAIAVKEAMDELRPMTRKQTMEFVDEMGPRMYDAM